MSPEYQREWRRRKSDAGRCSLCGARPARPSLKTCQVCANRQAAIDARRPKAIGRIDNRTHAGRMETSSAVAGWCDECIAFGFHRDGCIADRRSA